MTLAVLPLNLLLAGIMFHFSKRSFEEIGLKVRTQPARATSATC